MELDRDYLYHCGGCGKDDKDYPDKMIECEECLGEDVGAYVNDDNECWKCNDKGEYLDRVDINYHKWARNDAYGIYTRLYCDKCYKHNYPYKRGRYHDEAYCGERLEPNE